MIQKVKVPKTAYVMKMENIPFKKLEKVVNYNLSGRLVVEAVSNLQGVIDFKKDLKKDMLNKDTVNYIIEIGEAWFKSYPQKRTSFDNLVQKCIMYPEYKVMLAVREKTQYKQHKNLWDGLTKWGNNTKILKDNEWKLETCFQEWSKIMYHQKNIEDFWSFFPNYGNFLVRVLLYFMNFNKSPLGLSHCLLKSIGQNTRVEITNFVTKLLANKNNDTQDLIEEFSKSDFIEELKLLLEKYNTIKQKRGSVDRTNIPLTFYIFEADGQINDLLLDKGLRKSTKKTTKKKTKRTNLQNTTTSSDDLDDITSSDMI